MIKPIALTAFAIATMTGFWIEAANGGTTHVHAARRLKYVAIQKVFDANCIKCHGARPRGQIDLRSYESVMKGGEDGKIIVPGSPEKSVLAKALHGNGVRQMPPSGAIKSLDIRMIEAWIREGANNLK